MSLLPLISVKKNLQPRYSVSFDAIKFLKGLRDKKLVIVFQFDFEALPKRALSQRLLKNKELTSKTQNIGISIWNQTLSLSADTELVLLESENLETCGFPLFSSSGDLDDKTFLKLKFLSQYQNKLINKDKSSNTDIIFLLYSSNKELLSLTRNSSINQLSSFLNLKDKDSDHLKSLKTILSPNSFPKKALLGVEKAPSTQQIGFLTEQILEKITPKSLEGKAIRGPMVYKLAYEVVEFLKKDQAVNLQEVLEQIFSSEAKEILEEIKKEFSYKVKAELPEEESPFDQEEIDKIFKLGYHDYSNLLDSKLKEFADLEKYIELRNEFSETYDREYELFMEQNKQKSKEFCEEIIGKFFSNVAVPELTSLESIKPTLIREFEEDFQRLLEVYLNNARGPFKHTSLFDNIAPFLFQKFQKLYEGITSCYTQENNRTRISLLQMKEERDKLQASIKELENLRFEAEQLKENISRESESLKREFDYKLLSKDYNEESLKNALESKEKLVKKKKEQKKQLKTENSKFRENELKYRHEINLVFNEVSILKKKNKELERILDENLFTLIRDLKGQITSVEDQLQRKSSSSGSVEKEQNISQLSSANVDDLEEELRHKQLEIEKLKREKKGLKEELSQKLDQETKRFNKLKEFLNSEIENLKKEKDEMNKKMITFDNRDQELKNLQTEIIKKDQSIEFLNHLLELNKQQIESIVCEIADIKQANGDLKQFKDSIPFILSEGLRFAMKQTKSTKIAVSLRTMKDEDEKLIVRVFEEVGLHLKL